MTQTFPKIAIVYLAYHSDQYFPDMMRALKRVTYPKDRLALVIVDNPHPEHGLSSAYVRAHVLPRSGQSLPEIVYLPQTENLGFAGGNNAGMAWAMEHGFEYLYLHNDDGYVGHNAFRPLVEVMEKNSDIAMAQSLLLLYPETHLLNNAGNAFHYLGFGFCNEYRTPRSRLTLPSVKDIAYGSGAAMMVRVSAAREHGLFDHNFYMYHEDLEWCFRMRTRGYRVVLVRDSLFFHKYQFGRSVEKLYFMERNRFGVLLLFFLVSIE